jgi:trimeric autotransporter adhesin
MTRKFTILSFLAFACLGMKAQFNYKIGTSSVVSGTYVDLGTSGTAITTANTDDANSAATPIGFTFNYAGQTFTDFILNTNGFIKLGTVAPASAAIFGSSSASIDGGVLLASPAIQYCISPFNHDLIGGVAVEYRVSTVGSVGSRICTIQWKNVVDKTTTPVVQMASINFQIRLYETSNIIEFVYGTFTASTNASNFKTAAAGLIGMDTTAANTIFIRKNSGTAWINAFFANRTTVVNTTFQSLNLLFCQSQVLLSNLNLHCRMIYF